MICFKQQPFNKQKPFFKKGDVMKITETVCDNGLRLITGRIPKSKKVRFDFLAGVGSGYDPPTKEGLFHFFEHIAFKGTEQLVLAELESFRRRNILTWGASTGRIITKYYAEAVLHKQERVLNFLWDIYLRSSIPPTELEKEREIILNEIARNDDDDAHLAYCALWESLWRENPLRNYGTGTRETVNTIAREDLLSAQDLWYIPANTTIIATGNVIHEDILAHAKNFLSTQPCPPHRIWSDEYDLPPSKHEVVITRPQREKAILLFGCKFPLFVEDDLMRVTANILGNTLIRGESLLWREIREKRGLAYQFYGGIHSYGSLACYVYIYVETLPSRVEEVKEIVWRFLFAPLKDRELYEEKREWMYDWHTLEYGENELDNWANLIEESVMMGLPLKPVETLFLKQRKQISVISFEEVEALRAATFLPEKFVTVMILPT